MVRLIEYVESRVIKVTVITVLLFGISMLVGCGNIIHQKANNDWIDGIESIDGDICEAAWMEDNEYVTVNYCYLPTREGHLVYKTIFYAPAYEGYLIYELDGKVTFVQVAWDRTQVKYIKDSELFIGSESDMENTWTWEYGLSNGEVIELRTTSTDISEYEGVDYLEDAVWCDSLEKLRD